jgi:hypothetical protein
MRRTLRIVIIMSRSGVRMFLKEGIVNSSWTSQCAFIQSNQQMSDSQHMQCLDVVSYDQPAPIQIMIYTSLMGKHTAASCISTSTIKRSSKVPQLEAMQLLHSAIAQVVISWDWVIHKLNSI